jgi:hypothetical protein
MYERDSQFTLTLVGIDVAVSSQVLAAVVASGAIRVGAARIRAASSGARAVGIATLTVVAADPLMPSQASRSCARYKGGGAEGRVSHVSRGAIRESPFTHRSGLDRRPRCRCARRRRRSRRLPPRGPRRRCGALRRWRARGQQSARRVRSRTRPSTGSSSTSGHLDNPGLRRTGTCSESRCLDSGTLRPPRPRRRRNCTCRRRRCSRRSGRDRPRRSSLTEGNARPRRRSAT